MTATRTPPTSPAPRRAARPPAQRPPAPVRRAMPDPVRRTLLAMLAAALGIVPLKGLFSDSGWLIDVWLSIVVVLGPAAVLRRRRAPGALDIWPGIVLLVPWLTLRFLSDTAVAGIVPTGRTWSELSALMTDLHETTREEVAPIHTTVAVRLVLCALVGLLAALVDLIAVVGRRAALAGVPLLIVFTVSGAVPREPVAWPWFAIAGAGFLLLLAIDSGTELERWGRRVRASDDPRGRPVRDTGRAARSALSTSAPRIALVALVAAVALPLLVPGQARNLLANAFHGGGDGVGGFGGGGGSNGQINPFAALKGQLDRSDPRKLAEVQLLRSSDVDPYYLRSNVLSEYTDEGWKVGSHGERTPVAGGEFPVDAGGTPDTVSMRARISVDAMRGNPVVFNYPTSITGLSGDTGWSSQDQLLLDASIGEGSEYTVDFEQPAPSVRQLRDAPAGIDPAVRSELTVPDDLPSYARNLVSDLVDDARTPYERARAISDFFADPANGFSYDLQTRAGDSGSDLVDFLQNRRGYCQQYAAAMGVMLRVAGVPARVVLGYLNSGPDRNGRFAVSTLDAHAWVEAWFEGIGWVPFDPTPASGLPGGGGSLPWAPRDVGQDDGGATASTAPTTSASAPTSSAAAPTSAAPEATTAPVADGGGSASPTISLIVAAIVLALGLALAPALVRAGRRRRRFAAARHDGDAEALWAELSDTALDLGFVWSDARSPRQVASWLARDVPGSAEALHTLAEAVERGRYAGPGGAGGTATGGGNSMAATTALREVTHELRERRGTRTRWRARLLPASLRPGGLLGSGLRGRREL